MDEEKIPTLRDIEFVIKNWYKKEGFAIDSNESWFKVEIKSYYKSKIFILTDNTGNANFGTLKFHDTNTDELFKRVYTSFNFQLKCDAIEVTPVRRPVPCPYVDETGDEVRSYLIITNNSPWDADESEMVEVKDNSESHKLLRLLELHFDIPNRHKGN